MNLGILGVPGASFAGSSSLPSIQAYQTAGTFTFTIPDNCFKIIVEVWGGGSGGATDGATVWYSGGGGGYAMQAFAVSPRQTYTVVVGAGGLGTAGLPVGAGGTSSVTGPAGTVSATGGTTGTAGGTGSGGAINLVGGTGASAGSPAVQTHAGAAPMLGASVGYSFSAATLNGSGGQPANTPNGDGAPGMVVIYY
jgi:hypothetical protein